MDLRRKKKKDRRKRGRGPSSLLHHLQLPGLMLQMTVARLVLTVIQSPPVSTSVKSPQRPPRLKARRPILSKVAAAVKIKQKVLEGFKLNDKTIYAAWFCEDLKTFSSTSLLSLKEKVKNNFGPIQHKERQVQAEDGKSQSIASNLTKNKPMKLKLMKSKRGQCKGFTTTTLAPPTYLPCVQALHQWFHCYYSSAFFVPSKLNAIANHCSQLWRTLSDANLLSHFDTHYPQTASWCLAIPQPEVLALMTSMLYRQQPVPVLFLLAPMPMTTPGLCGPTSAMISSSTLGSPTCQTQFYYYKSLASVIDNRQDCPPQAACQI
jgi:hypothetical protein